MINREADITVWFIKEGKKPEGIWVRALDGNGEQFIGKMLNEPWGNHGIHEGDAVSFLCVDVDNEKKAVALLK